MYKSNEITKPIFNPEQQPAILGLSDREKQAILDITQGISSVVDPEVIGTAIGSGDIVRTLENGHPLNRLITNDSGEVIGYIACQDFTPHEAYLKYFATNASSGRSAFKEIPAFLAYAKSQGYQKLNFHGWNETLNRILQRYGFVKIGTENFYDSHIDYYQLDLTQDSLSKEPEAPAGTASDEGPVSRRQLSPEEQAAFQEKLILRINETYQALLSSLPEDKQRETLGQIQTDFTELNPLLNQRDSFVLSELQTACLRLKLLRHYQHTDSQNLDYNTLADAIVETPKFLQQPKGSLERLLEIHEQKTLQGIAERRRLNALRAKYTKELRDIAPGQVNQELLASFNPEDLKTFFSELKETTLSLEDQKLLF